MKYTNQSLFNKVSKHLLTQNKRSKLTKDLCAYKSKNGLECAAGCLIPIKLYSMEFEGKIWDDIIRMEPKLKKMFSCEQHAIIDSLQYIHDSYLPSEWKSELKDCAYENKLKFNY